MDPSTLDKKSIELIVQGNKKRTTHCHAETVQYVANISTALFCAALTGSRKQLIIVCFTHPILHVSHYRPHHG